MPKTYTLTRFYKEAEMLIVKHKCMNPDFSLCVNFKLEGDDSSVPNPKMNCSISYRRQKFFEEEDAEVKNVIYGYGETPQLALLTFKINLIEPVYTFPPVGICLGKEFLGE